MINTEYYANRYFNNWSNLSKESKKACIEELKNDLFKDSNSINRLKNNLIDNCIRKLKELSEDGDDSEVFQLWLNEELYSKNAYSEDVNDWEIELEEYILGSILKTDEETAKFRCGIPSKSVTFLKKVIDNNEN